MIPLSKCIVYNNVWAPVGFYGWMLKTPSGRTYPFRTYEASHREVYSLYIYRVYIVCLYLGFIVCLFRVYMFIYRESIVDRWRNCVL